MQRTIPAGILALAAAYFAASLAHFLHNAELIAYYPNMPAWITRETVYLAWASIIAIGLAGLIAVRFGWRALGALLIGAYGAMGLDGLGHYALALCSEHTLATNATIWGEAVTGLILSLAATLFAVRRVARRLEWPA